MSEYVNQPHDAPPPSEPETPSVPETPQPPEAEQSGARADERSAALEARLAALEAREQERASQPVTQPSGDFTHTGIELVGRHLPEDHVEVLSQHERRVVQLPGTYELGALIEGAFIPIARLKAAEVLEAVERAVQSAEQPDDSQE